MKKILFLPVLALGLFFQSCTQEDSIVASRQSVQSSAPADSNAGSLLPSIVSIYQYDKVAADGNYYYAINESGKSKMTYRFFSTSTDIANNVIKLSVYFADQDSTYFLYANPDDKINKVTYRGIGGNHVSEYTLNNQQDLYLFASKELRSLDVSSSDPGLRRALVMTLAYTFNPSQIGGDIYPKDPGGNFKVTVRPGLAEAMWAQLSQCGGDGFSCWRRDGYIRVGNIWMVWGACIC